MMITMLVCYHRKMPPEDLQTPKPGGPVPAEDRGLALRRGPGPKIGLAFSDVHRFSGIFCGGGGGWGGGGLVALRAIEFKIWECEILGFQGCDFCLFVLF